ncbi:DUF805 domain-containing protein [Polaribacter undariae]|uniref:DUF805 domain-containing protein n=1 Tax=Polaribacter sejongensis TaxID=985043 RepID=A0AAJ1QXN8_9FLAO|nr:DUF805 domain-containing protein [Polaribacter undariae]MDN3620121.1 DUF805 domain-containing protein [Polaribacter undariae]UWD32524.1 DUF805 domain-containing protein [Polaribacter undariae]
MNWYIKVIKQYSDFKGRARRQEYWMFILINTIISIGFMFMDKMFGTNYGELGEDGYLETLYSLAVLVPYIAVTARRMHDVGKSGWYMLIPIYNFILACSNSENGENKWGENPKGEGNSSEINQIGQE